MNFIFFGKDNHYIFGLQITVQDFLPVGCFNALGYLRVMFTVEDLDDTLARLGKRGTELVGDVVQYGDVYRLCYIRGPEGILLGLAQQLGEQASRANPMD